MKIIRLLTRSKLNQKFSLYGPDERVLAGLDGFYDLNKQTYTVTWSDSAQSSTPSIFCNYRTPVRILLIMFASESISINAVAIV